MSNPFSGGIYLLDGAALKSLEVHVSGEPGAECQLDGTEATFDDVYYALHKEGPKMVDRKLRVDLATCEVTTGSCKHEVSNNSPSFSFNFDSMHLFEILFQLEIKGVRPWSCNWYYYSMEYCLDEPKVCYHFFLEQYGEIVSPNDSEMPLVMLYGSWEDTQAAFFLEKLPTPESWFSGDLEQFNASLVETYTRFYETTRPGRIMVLRSDKPYLFYYSRPDDQPLETDTATTVIDPAKVTDGSETLIEALKETIRMVELLLAVWKDKVANFEAIAEAAKTGEGIGALPEDVKLLVWTRDGGACVQCGVSTELQFDHVIPIAKGGGDQAENIQILCRACNLSKSEGTSQPKPDTDIKCPSCGWEWPDSTKVCATCGHVFT